jgi:hypothetical protein
MKRYPVVSSENLGHGRNRNRDRNITFPAKEGEAEDFGFWILDFGFWFLALLGTRH